MILFAMAEWQLHLLVMLVLAAFAVGWLTRNPTAKDAAKKGATYAINKWLK